MVIINNIDLQRITTTMNIDTKTIEQMMVVEVIESDDLNQHYTHHVYMDKPENMINIDRLEDCEVIINVNEDDFAEWASHHGFLEWEALKLHDGEIICDSGSTPYQEFIESNPFFLEENIKDYLIDKATQRT